VLAASTVWASPPKKKSATIDVKAVIDQLDVYRDDTGSYVVVAKPGQLTETHDKWVFHGTAKAMYQQRIIGSSSDSNGYEYAVWSPRVRGRSHAGVLIDKDGLRVECVAKGDPQKLALVPADEAKTFLARAKFLPPLWQRRTQFLARDEDGVYYFVDRLDDEHGGKGHRVFVGQKGAMKQLAMKNVVSDSAGEIYATRSGELKIVTGADGKAIWKKGGKKSELVVLDPWPNRYLIYRELGIYGALGAVCDEH